MTVYQKLNAARKEFHQLKLVKTGHNKFAGYNYFELGDFLIPALDTFDKHGLCAIVSFEKEIATMTIVDMDLAQQIVITSPMGSASLKGCHEVQNIGAVETYQRRYLWVAALEIVEHDELDATRGNPKAVKKTSMQHRPTDGAIVDPTREGVINAVATAVIDRFNANDLIGAYEEYSGLQDGEELTKLWDKLPSHIRSAIKKHTKSLEAQPA